MNTKERAQKLAEEVLEMTSNILMDEIGGSLRPEKELAPVVPLIEKHIHAAQREAMERCAAKMESLERLYGRNLGACDTVAAIRILIERLGKD